MRTDPTTKERMRQLRGNQTDAEKALWFRLRDRRLEGFKFSRQVPIDRYIVDFVCREEKLIVELDRGQHMLTEPYDASRTAHLGTRGYRVLRFWNNQVLN